MSEFEEIELRANSLCFSAVAQGGGPLVLCLHGFPDTMRSFRHQLPALADGGFRAIAPMLRGYEPLSQPDDKDYHIVRMAEDVVGMIDDLDETKVHLVGHDMGAIIAYATAALAPERLRTLTTLGVAHPGRVRREGLWKLPSQLAKSWYIGFFQLRGLADWIIERNDWAFIDRLWHTWSPGWTPPQTELTEVKITLRQPGVKHAALAYYRGMLDPLSSSAKETNRLLAGKIPVPTLALTGIRDGCMDTRLHDLTLNKQDFPQGLQIVRVDDAGHFLHQERPEQVNRILLQWLRRHDQSMD